jgi:ABC-type branched-subunit amino acid transport system substrate-binding protein
MLGGLVTVASSTAASASSTPILVGGMDSLSNPLYSAPETQSGLNAGIQDVNSHGGVNGHPLKADFCNTNYLANQEYSCTLQLINNGVAALVSPSILADQSGREYTAMAGAKVADIGGEGLSPAELSSPIAFPLSSGLPGWFYGAAAALVAKGDTKIAILTDPNPASQYSAQLIAQALKSAGITPLQTVTADVTSDPTLSTAAAKVVQGANGIVLTPSPVIIPKIVPAIRATGYKGAISSITALFPPAILKATGSSTNGILLDSQIAFTTTTSNPGVKQFLSDMKKYAPGAAIDNTSLNAWSAVMLYAKVASAAKAVTRAQVLAAFTNLKNPVNIYTAAPYKVVGTTQPLAPFTRIFNPTVVYGSVKNGQVVASTGAYVNPFTALKNAAKG